MVDLEDVEYSSSLSLEDLLALPLSCDTRLFTGEGLLESLEYLLLEKPFFEGPSSGGVGGGGVGGLEYFGEGGRLISPRRNTEGLLGPAIAPDPTGEKVAVV